MMLMLMLKDDVEVRGFEIWIGTLTQNERPELGRGIRPPTQR
jgi:hypothetical protein